VDGSVRTKPLEIEFLIARVLVQYPKAVIPTATQDKAEIELSNHGHTLKIIVVKFNLNVFFLGFGGFRALLAGTTCAASLHVAISNTAIFRL
jgi:hypothetical protein